MPLEATKPYSPPTLTTYGTLAKLTAAGSGGVTENSSKTNPGDESNSRNKRP